MKSTDPPAEAVVDRRGAIVAARVAETGIDEAMVHRLVHSFYGKVRGDPMLGPIFEAGVADWDAHLAKLCDFWSSVALMTGRFAGKPVQAHAPLPIDGGHFERWLRMFGETAQEVCPPPAAAFFIERAQMIAGSLQLARAQSAAPAAPSHGRVVARQG